MRFKTAYLTGALAAFAIGVAVWACVHTARAGEEDADKSDDSKPAVPVTTVPIRSGQVSQTITVYGNVTADPAAITILSSGVECRVKHLRVSGGESVDPGTPVIEVEPSPDARLQMTEARNALQSAKKRPPACINGSN